MRLCEKSMISESETLRRLTYDLYLLFKKAGHKKDAQILQSTIEVAFEFATLEQSKKSIRVLLELEYFVTQLVFVLEATRTDTRPGEFYKFKRLQLLGVAYGNIAAVRGTDEVLHLRQLQLAAYQQSMLVWEKLHSEEYFGSNSGIYNPFEEAANVFDTIGILECMNGRYPEAVAAFQRSRALFERYLFSAIDTSLTMINPIPKSFILSYFQMMRNTGTCLSTFDIPSAIEIFQQIEISFEGQHMAFPRTFLDNFDMDHIYAALNSLRQRQQIEVASENKKAAIKSQANEFNFNDQGSNLQKKMLKKKKRKSQSPQ